MGEAAACLTTPLDKVFLYPTQQLHQGTACAEGNKNNFLLVLQIPLFLFRYDHKNRAL